MIRLPSGEMISAEELLRFKKAHREARKHSREWERWLNDQPTYFDDTNIEAPFNDFGEFTIANLTENAEELIEGRRNARGNFSIPPIQNRQEFEIKLNAMERAASGEYINKKLRQYQLNYAESLITTFGDEGQEMANRILNLSQKEFVQLALKYDLSIKYTDSDKYANPFTTDRESQLMYERLSDAILGGDL